MTNWWRFLWKLQLPPKIKHFLWKICHNCIPSFANLAARHIAVDPLCRFCHQAAEVPSHALWSCRLLICIREACGFLSSASWVDRASMLDFLLWCKDQLRPSEFNLLAVVLWAVWNRHNALLHHRSSLPPEAVVPWCEAYLAEFMDSNAKVPLPSSNRFVRWIPPIDNVLKINVDAARSKSAQITGLGAVIRNSSGEVLMTGIDYITGLLDPTIAECKAILFGLSLAVGRGLPDLVIESDCAQVIKLLNDNNVVLSDIGLVLSDIHEILRLFSSSISFVHVRRNGNLVAHSLAKLAISKVDCFVWVDDFPPSVGSLIEVDSNFSL
ncbi:hypothetical protein ACOSP7_013813 [Xanthoceras sorbifolium]